MGVLGEEDLKVVVVGRSYFLYQEHIKEVFLGVELFCAEGKE